MTGQGKSAIDMLLAESFKELAQKQQQVQPDPNSAAENTVGRP